MSKQPKNTPHRSREFYAEAKRQAHELFLLGWSLREIAARILPGQSGGFVTIARWSKEVSEEGMTWQQEKAALEQQQREEDRRKYLHVLSQVKDRNLRLADKAMTALEMSLDNYFVRDEDGGILDIRRNPKTGNPIIMPRDFAPLLHAVHEVQARTLGMEQMPYGEVQQMVASEVTEVVDMVPSGPDPQLLKAIGDFVAQKSLASTPPPPVDAPGETPTSSEQ